MRQSNYKKIQDKKENGVKSLQKVKMRRPQRLWRDEVGEAMEEKGLNKGEWEHRTELGQ